LLSIAGVTLLAAHLGIHDADSLVRWCGAQLGHTQGQLSAPFKQIA